MREASLSDLATDPTRLASLSGRGFERVIAELLASFGWKVSVASGAQDSRYRYDILAIADLLPGIQLSCVVECKRYSRYRLVPISDIERLFFLTRELRIPIGLLVTTGHISSPLRNVSATKPAIRLVGPDELGLWLRSYRHAAGGQPYLATRSFQSCFVSHSSLDVEFVSLLVTSLREKGVGIWFAPDDLVPGEHLHDQIKQGISAFDRLLVVLSEASLKSSWVRTELVAAFKREHTGGGRVLFPVSLLPFDQLRDWSLFDPDTGLDIAHAVRSYFVLDFSNWREPDAFNSSVDRLLRALGRPRDDA